MRLASLSCVLGLAVIATACGPSGDSPEAPAAAGGDPPAARTGSASLPPTENPRGAKAPEPEATPQAQKATETAPVVQAAAASEQARAAAAEPATAGSAAAAPAGVAQQAAAAVQPAGAAPPSGGSVVLGDASKGDSVYQTFCSSCHGPRGDGDGPVAIGLDPKPAKHSDGAYMNTLSNEHLFRVVKEGGPAVGKSPLMAPWAGTLTDEQIRDVIAFVRSLAKPPYDSGA